MPNSYGDRRQTGSFPNIQFVYECEMSFDLRPQRSRFARETSRWSLDPISRDYVAVTQEQISARPSYEGRGLLVGRSQLRDRWSKRAGPASGRQGQNQDSIETGDDRWDSTMDLRALPQWRRSLRVCWIGQRRSTSDYEHVYDIRYDSQVNARARQSLLNLTCKHRCR